MSIICKVFCIVDPLFIVKAFEVKQKYLIGKNMNLPNMYLCIN